MIRKRGTGPGLPVVHDEKSRSSTNKGGGGGVGWLEGLTVVVLSFFATGLVHRCALHFFSSEKQVQEVASAVAPQPPSSSEILSIVSAENNISSCTSSQLEAIKKQLNPAHLNCHSRPWTNQCPITLNTQCVAASWLTNYYSKADISTQPFLSINVGCNAGYNSVDLLRMGTMDSSVDVAAWGTALENANAKGIAKWTCGKDNPDTQFRTPSGTSPRRSGQVYCVEPLPISVEWLNAVNGATGYASKGLHVHNYLISSEQGSVMYPKEKGVERCDAFLDVQQRDQKCASVAVTTLDLFVNKNVAETSNINVLLSNSDGYNFDVLTGGTNTLRRTEYLEFGFNWKDRWGISGRNIGTATSLLDTIGFTCYWAGERKLWRITSCSFPEYDDSHKFWSNIACVNRNLAPGLAIEMEQVFLSTIQG